MAKSNPQKSETSERYERLLKGEIDADQYVKSLEQEARGRYRSAITGRYAKSASTRRAKRAAS